MRQIYLDYNVTTPIAPAVLDAMLPALAEHFGSPTSSHVLGRAAAEALIDARERVAARIGADREEIVFTSGGTEGNNLALKGIMLGAKPAAGGHLVISAIEHPSISQPARWLEAWGYDVSVVPCDRRGRVDPDDVASAIRADTKLASIMHAHGETGVLQPLREISAVCREREVLLHTDASQSIGKVPVNVDQLGIDLLTLSGHKFYAPKGTGALYVRRGTPLSPVIHGAGNEGGLRSGTENVAAAVALGKAAQLIGKDLDDAAKRMEQFRDRLWKLLREAIGKGLSLNGAKAKRLPNTLSVNFPHVDGQVLLARIPELCASTGALCHSGDTHVSATLAAMGVPQDVARGAVRLSLGWQTTEEDITRAASLLIHSWQSMRGV
jgi:cysteine desulfurase